MGGTQFNLVTSDPIGDRVFLQGEITVVHWGLLPVVGKCEPWAIVPYVMLPSGYVRRCLVSPVYLENI